MMEARYTKRILARVTIEATTPLHVGTGSKSVLTDRMVGRDVNGLPYIPGTSLAGVLRHVLTAEDAKRVFGTQDKGMEHGSELLFSDARMVGRDGLVVDGMTKVDWDDDFYRHFRFLPIRQHVGISHKGAARATAKFDEEVVMKGTRFVFCMEQLSATEDMEVMDCLLEALSANTFRLGGGTTKGFGQVRVMECQTRIYDLTDAADLQAYLDRSSSLSEHIPGGKPHVPHAEAEQAAGVTAYELTLEPEDFFLFGAGIGDDDADAKPVTESVVKWSKDGVPHVAERQTLLPATSIKGALLHRSIYHYNKEHHVYADTMDPQTLSRTEGSSVMESIFGTIGDNGRTQTRGRIRLNDIVEAPTDAKVMNHVRIDRLTGGTVDGALFTEKVSSGKGCSYVLHVSVLPGVEAEALKAFESALEDVCRGMLPLGGSVNRGCGLFKGVLMRNGVQVYPQNKE